MTLLIVDDDEVDRRAIIRAMKKSSVPIEIQVAETASEGLSLARQIHFDVVLLDYRLPDQDGIEVLKQLQAIEGRNMTIVMLSHQDDLELARQAIGAGAQDFLLKEEVSEKRLLRTVYQAQQRNALKEDLRISNAQLRQLAEQDSLTGLANRYDFERALHIAVGRASREDHGVAVLLLDIDKFKQVNDTHGHDVGDRVLVETARRLRLVVRDSDVLARLGGDEFVVLLQGITKKEQPILLANRIICAFSEPFSLADIRLAITTSIGIASFGECADDPVSLFKCADIALYRAKQEGRNQSHFYSDQLHEAVRDHAELERGLRVALEQDQFRVHYQAQVDAGDGSLRGMEALLRWQHPERGLLNPGHFLSQAEEMGLMPAIGQWVLDTACRQLREWQLGTAGAAPGVTIAVNLSAAQLHSPGLQASAKSALAMSGLPANCLELEITESSLIKKPEQIATELAAITGMGIGLALDDFGTGYSSFDHLRLFPITRLKIDQRFVQGIGCGEVEDRLLYAMVSFGKALGLTVVAEGVETQAQAAVCRTIGCDLLQGFYFSRPVSADEFAAAFLARAIPA